MKSGIRWVVAAASLIAGTFAASAATAQSNFEAPVSPQNQAIGLPDWSAANVALLRDALANAPAEGIPAFDTRTLDRAVAEGDRQAVAKAANGLGMRLARAILLGCATPSERTGWKIPDSDRSLDLKLLLGAALAEGRLGGFFEDLRPRHPDYAVLRRAYATESDPARKAKLARNLDRWRWLPRDLGPDFVIVNAASFEVSLWRAGARIGTWPVIVGKPKSPTPVFAATITGITFNPWWDIPSNIVRESVGALVRKNPALARQRGYVWGGGRYRQRPGPNNSLGQMKLVMPHSHSVYLHDTPNKDLFSREVRAFSHGCVRVGGALGFAATLLDSAPENGSVTAIVDTGRTTTVSLPRPVPVYVTYFTATVRADGQLAFMPDIYGRDKRLGDAANPVRQCAS